METRQIQTFFDQRAYATRIDKRVIGEHFLSRVGTFFVKGYEVVMESKDLGIF